MTPEEAQLEIQKQMAEFVNQFNLDNDEKLIVAMLTSTINCLIEEKILPNLTIISDGKKVARLLSISLATLLHGMEFTQDLVAKDAKE